MDKENYKEKKFSMVSDWSTWKLKVIWRDCFTAVYIWLALYYQKRVFNLLKLMLARNLPVTDKITASWKQKKISPKGSYETVANKQDERNLQNS